MVEGQGLVGRGGEDHRACSVPRYAGALLAHAYLTTLRCAQCSLGALMPRSHSDLVVAGSTRSRSLVTCSWPRCWVSAQSSWSKLLL